MVKQKSQKDSPKAMKYSCLSFCLILVWSVGAADKEPDYSKLPRLPDVKPPGNPVVEKSIERGIYFLQGNQNKNGSWGSPRNTKGLNIYAPTFQSHYAFRLAVTALCTSAMIEAGGDHPRARALEAKEVGKVKRIEAVIQQQFDRLDRYESVDGGWGYYDFRLGTKKPASSSISFVNATVLVAFHEAKAAGIEPPKHLVKRALAALKRQHLPDGSFLYGEYLQYKPRQGINRPAGSLGRSQAGNIALRLWGDKKITDQVIVTWLDRLFARNEWLGIGRKRPVPHEAWFQIAGYFYYYGHYYAGLLLEHVPEKDRPRLQDHLASTLMKLQEKEGDWWDYPLYDYHRQYGTAMAVMALQRCLRKEPEPK